MGTKTYQCRGNCSNLRAAPYFLCPVCWGSLPPNLQQPFSDLKHIEEENARREAKRRAIADCYAHLHGRDLVERRDLISPTLRTVEDNLIDDVKNTRHAERLAKPDAERNVDDGWAEMQQQREAERKAQREEKEKDGAGKD